MNTIVNKVNNFNSLNVAIMHYDLPRTFWHAKELQDVVYKYLPDFGINYKLFFNNEELPNPDDIELIDISEWCNPWHQKVAQLYSSPIVCTTDEGSIISLKNYLHNNGIDIAFMLSRIDHFIARSSWTRDLLVQYGIDGKKISIIPYGIDIDLFKPSNNEHIEPSFLYVGDINRQRGVHHLINSYLKIMDKTDWKLKLCIGDNNDKGLLEYIKLLTKKHDKIQLIFGPTTIPEIYNQATCFCMIQDYRNPAQSSYQSMWALGCGLPIISLHIGALIDYIKHGSNGFLCSSIEEIPEKMLKVAQGDWKSMGNISREIATIILDPKINAAKYNEIYRSVIK